MFIHIGFGMAMRARCVYTLQHAVYTLQVAMYTLQHTVYTLYVVIVVSETVRSVQSTRSMVTFSTHDNIQYTHYKQRCTHCNIQSTHYR
jgi:hypothetical protein